MANFCIVILYYATPAAEIASVAVNTARKVLTVLQKQ